MRLTRIIACLAVLVIGSATIPPAEPATLAQSDKGEPLVNTLCVACHSLGRMMAAHKSEEGWRDTIERHDLQEGQILDNELEIIITYLTERYGVEPTAPEIGVDLQGDWQFSFQGSAKQLHLTFSTKHGCETARSRGIQSAQDTLAEYGKGSGDAQIEKRIIQLQRVLRTTTSCHPVEE